MLIRLSLRNLTHEKVKFMIGLVSVGLAITLILVLLGIYSGAIKQAKSIPLNSGADFWIVQDGTRDMFHTVSILPSGYEDRIKQISSISEVSPAINAPTSIKVEGESFTAGILAFDPTTNLLGPPKITDGTNIKESGQVVVDQAIARQYGVKIGQKIHLFNRQYTVVGLSVGSNAIAFQYIFISLDDYRMAHDKSNAYVSYYLVKSDLSSSEIKAKINNILPGATVRPTKDVAEDNLKVIEQSFLNIIKLLVVVGAAVGTLIVSITVYNATTERIRDYAILKAIGARASWLRVVVLIQTIITSVGGFVIGLFGFALVKSVAPSFIPSIEMNLPLTLVLVVGAGTLVMAFIGAMIPINKINKVDPVEVFNA